ncbi:hypothetical protein [Phormidium tenue]|uniref:hypothetical protein n=1 Tax=Phormidium tenue TaxID=126344 RepID=UPI0018F01138|nr:hypothetical protein [Phormidium tenue]
MGLTLGCSSPAPNATDGGPTIADSQPHSHGASDQADSGHSEAGDHHHRHGTVEIPAGQPVPTVTLVAHPDPVRGWNLEIQTTNFRFAPEQVNQANQPNVGHGHLSINGESISRVYGPWLHLPHLPPGRNEITVSLNANGHEAFTHNGQAIESTVVVDVPK